MATTLTNSTSQVVLASYGTSNPFSVGSGVSITAGIYGDASQSWTLSNAGTVSGSGGYYDAESYSGGSGGAGISMSGGGTLTNVTGGAIVGGSGAYGRYGGGGGASGVALDGFGTIVNQSGAVIYGGSGGNATELAVGDGGAGIVLVAGGSVTNAGTIGGGGAFYGADPSVGVLFVGSANSTLINSGTISGGEASDSYGRAVQFGSGDDRLILYSGSVLVGGADGGSGSNTLELAGGGASGTISSAGATLSNFQTIAVDSDAQWTVSAGRLAGASRLTVNGSLTLPGGPQLSETVTGAGTLTLQGSVTTIVEGATVKVANLTLSDSAAVNVNENLAYSGKLTEGAGTRVTVRTGEMLAVTGTIAGSGALDIGVGSILRIAGTAGAAESVAFGANSGKLTLINPKRFRSGITHFVAGDKIDIANANFAFNKNETLTFVENAKKTEGTLTLKNEANVVALRLFGQHVAQGFHIAGDGHGGTMITYKPPAAHALDHLASSGGG